jgi:hypothetical protein
MINEWLQWIVIFLLIYHASRVNNVFANHREAIAKIARKLGIAVKESV